MRLREHLPSNLLAGSRAHLMDRERSPVAAAIWLLIGFATALIFMLANYTQLATAAESRSRIVVVAAGEAYNGPPEFRLTANGKMLGSKRVTESIDTSTGDTLPLDSKGLAQYRQRFVYSLNQDLEAINSIEIDFVNDEWAGEGKAGDRNLYILSVSVQENGFKNDFGPTSFAPIGKEGDPEITENYAALYSVGKLRLEKPPGGWISGKAAKSDPQMSCSEARRMIRQRYKRVRTVECRGRVYTLRAVTRGGRAVTIKVNAPLGTYWLM